MDGDLRFYFSFRLGGLVLDQAVDAFNGFVVFQPIINGIGGNLVSVQASKMSTFLHQSSILGIVPPHSQICENPFRALVTGGNSEIAPDVFMKNKIYHFDFLLQFLMQKPLEFLY